MKSSRSRDELPGPRAAAANDDDDEYGDGCCCSGSWGGAYTAAPGASLGFENENHDDFPCSAGAGTGSVFDGLAP